MSPFREACYAAGVGEFAVISADVASGRVELVRVAREHPLQLSGCTLRKFGDNGQRMATAKRTGGMTKKRTPAAKSRTPSARKTNTPRRSQ